MALQDFCVKTSDYQDFMASLDAKSVDLILTDPPYCISKKTGFSAVVNGEKRYGQRLSQISYSGSSGEENRGIRMKMKIETIESMVTRAERGLQLIEEAILAVLLEAKQTGEAPLLPIKISEHLGLSSYKDKSSSVEGVSYTLIREVLLHLEYHGNELFQRDPVENSKWKLTPEGERAIYSGYLGGSNMAIDMEEIIKRIASLSVQELSELVKTLEDRFGVSALLLSSEFNVNLDEVDFNNFIIKEDQLSLFDLELEEEEQEIPEGEHRHFVYAWRWGDDKRFAKIGRTRNGLKGVWDRMVTTYNPTENPVLIGVRKCTDVKESHKIEQYILNGLRRTRPDREWVEIDEAFNKMIEKSFDKPSGPAML